MVCGAAGMVRGRAGRTAQQTERAEDAPSICWLEKHSAKATAMNLTYKSPQAQHMGCPTHGASSLLPPITFQKPSHTSHCRQLVQASSRVSRDDPTCQR